MNPVSATLTLEEAAARAWDAVVVGAGCAGAMAAYGLARRGVTVLLVDKASFPRWKVCGGTLNRRALTALEAAGLGDLPQRHGAPLLNRFHVAAGGKSLTIPLPGYRAISRETLDSALVEEAKRSGAAFLPGAKASLTHGEDAYRSVALQKGERKSEARARLVLAADGLGGKLLRTSEEFESSSSETSRIGAGAMVSTDPDSYEPGVIFMACGAGGYVGAVRVEDGRLEMGAAFDAEFVKAAGGLAEASERIIAEAGFPPISGIHDSTWRGTPALTRKASKISAHRVLVLGDAAGYVEPFTGEGMAWALTSGVAIVDVACRGINRFDAAVEGEWGQLHRRIVMQRQYPCRALAVLLRYPKWTRRAIVLFSWFPLLARPVVRHVNSPLRLQVDAKT